MNHTNGSMEQEVQLPNLIVNSILSIVSLYLLISFSFFEYTTFYWTVGGPDERHNKIARTLRIFCIVGISFAFVHYVCEVFAPFVADPSACQAMSTMWLLTYALGILTAYVFLWKRQHCLYEGPALKHLLNGYLKAFSWVALGFLVLSAVLVFMAGSRMIFFSGCSHSTDSQKLKLYETILAIILLALTVLGQVQLLVLFIIPLRSHTLKLKKSGNSPRRETSESATPSEYETRHRANTNGAPTTGKSIRKKGDSRASIISLVKRCLILATVCMIGDLIAAVVTIVTENAAGKLAYDINLVVNILCCLGSFKTWTSMIFPWKRTRKAQRTRERIVSVRYLHADTEIVSI